MENFAQKVLTTTIGEGQIGVFFLGQAGFVLKTAGGKLIAIDPYLSDCCERYFGFKRLMPHILSADTLTGPELFFILLRSVFAGYKVLQGRVQLCEQLAIRKSSERPFVIRTMSPI